MSSNTISIREFYRDKCIFITGATGFMGKVLMEKLLRSCKDIKMIYVLMRQKRGKGPQERIEEVFNTKVFDRLKQTDPTCLKKVTMVAGDITYPNLGLSQSDIDVLAKNVSIVFHMAATVRFDEPLKQAIKKNVVGTRYMLDVCQKFPHLLALVHVSTAYSHCNRKEVGEQIYPSPIDIQKIIDTVEWFDDNTVEAITPHLIVGRPNTYTYTKALAENLLVEECGQLPVVIVRPSIVSSSWKEPFPGWVDSFNGPTGIIAAGFKGVLRTLICNGECICNLIPVDMSINLLIVAAWKRGTCRENQLTIYNNTSTNCITWDCVYKYVFPLFTVYPPLEVFRLPGGNCTTNRIWNNFRNIIDHYIPALTYDVVSYVMGKKPIMMKLYRKLYKSLDSLEYFTTNEWIFRCDNTIALYETLSPEEKQVFNFDTSDLNWLTYWEESILGIRKFLFKDDHSSLPVARRSVKRSYYFSMTVRVLVMLSLCYFMLERWGGVTVMLESLYLQMWRLFAFFSNV